MTEASDKEQSIGNGQLRCRGCWGELQQVEGLSRIATRRYRALHDRRKYTPPEYEPNVAPWSSSRFEPEYGRSRFMGRWLMTVEGVIERFLMIGGLGAYPWRAPSLRRRQPCCGRPCSAAPGPCRRHHAQGPGPGRAQLRTVLAIRSAHSPTLVHWPAADSQRCLCVGRNVAQQADAGTNSAPDNRTQDCCLRARIENIPGHQAELLSEVYPELGAQTCWYAGAVRMTAVCTLWSCLHHRPGTDHYQSLLQAGQQ